MHCPPRLFLIGTRSADYIRASSQSGCIKRPNTWLHPNASLNVRFPLQRGRRPYMARPCLPASVSRYLVGAADSPVQKRGCPHPQDRAFTPSSHPAQPPTKPLTTGSFLHEALSRGSGSFFKWRRRTPHDMSPFTDSCRHQLPTIPRYAHTTTDDGARAPATRRLELEPFYEFCAMHQEIRIVGFCFVAAMVVGGDPI